KRFGDGGRRETRVAAVRTESGTLARVPPYEEIRQGHEELAQSWSQPQCYSKWSERRRDHDREVHIGPMLGAPGGEHATHRESRDDQRAANAESEVRGLVGKGDVLLAAEARVIARESVLVAMAGSARNHHVVAAGMEQRAQLLE